MAGIFDTLFSPITGSLAQDAANAQRGYGLAVPQMSDFLLGPNSRAWRADDVEKWLAERPTEPSAHVLRRTERSLVARRAAA
jgi:hypothetical protein